MPLLCYGERRSPSQLDDDNDEADGNGNAASIWQKMPDSILLQIFSSLNMRDLCTVSVICKVWNRVSEDEVLWRDLFHQQHNIVASQLATGKTSWREEVRRLHYHAPVILTEMLTNHSDEVLHVSFSHDGKYFSSTSKDATLKVWEMGYPTRVKYSKDFRTWLEWDFTQFSCFNESDTMVLVSSVKSTDIMDRRGYMAILSITNDFEVVHIVTMDPSQLFGAWLDDRTFLGGSLEISLDRFATTVQIEAHQVTDETSEGAPILFTFSSETASLIKFLTVSSPLPQCDIDYVENTQSSSLDLGSIEKIETGYISNENIETDYSNTLVSVPGSSKTGYSENSLTDTETGTGDLKCLNRPKENLEAGISMESDDWVESRLDRRIVHSTDFLLCQECKQTLGNISEEQLSSNLCDICQKLAKPVNSKEFCPEVEMKVPDSELNVGEHDSAVYNDRYEILDLDTNKTSGACASNNLTKKSSAGQNEKSGATAGSSSGKFDSKLKNLIFVTGEFAVALHQLGFKNIPPSRRISALSGEGNQLNEENADAYNMVVNYSNNDIHIVQRQRMPDKPDHLIDLHGHVTGLCLTPDQRYLFINCRPWIGEIDRTDPWATPELSPNIEVRIIDLCTLKDVGVQYSGHKGFSPSNMCCFVFLDVSQDYVASGSEDAKGYLWDRHYRCLLTNYVHDTGVVNAVAFSPANQEYLATASDDKTIKVWRSRSEVKRLGITLPGDENKQCLPGTSKCDWD